MPWWDVGNNLFAHHSILLFEANNYYDPGLLLGDRRFR
jgi:hypothetical protein